ncbi:MAG: sterol desaturase family protein [Formosimonas sp.]
MPTDILHALMVIALFGTMFVILIAWEAWYWRTRDRHDVYNFKETVSNIATALLYKVTDGLLVAFFASTGFAWVQQFSLHLQPSNPWVSAVVLFIAVDLTFWFYHYFLHKVRWGWVGHSIHHSSSRFNLSTALRQNFLIDFTFVAAVWWLPVAWLGFDKMSVIVAIELNLFYQFFIHTQVIERLPRWVEFVFNTPSHHRVHHGRNSTQIDRNFGGVLIVWDRLFGTFVDERDAGQIDYGIGLRQPNSLNPLWLSVAEFCYMWRDAWRYKDLRVLWKNPDWVEQTYLVSKGDA